MENCSLISWQDTFLCKGYVWVHNSLIAGHVDYIWGDPNACLFEDCEIRSRAHFFSRVVFAMLSVFLYIAKYYLLKN